MAVTAYISSLRETFLEFSAPRGVRYSRGYDRVDATLILPVLNCEIKIKSKMQTNCISQIPNQGLQLKKRAF